jgi:signal transduction histidine kinase
MLRRAISGPTGVPGVALRRRMRMRRSIWGSLVALLPHGYQLADADWQRRHRLLQWVLLLHVPGLYMFGVFLRTPPEGVLFAVTVPAGCLLLGWLLTEHRRVAASFVTLGLVYSSAALVALTEGTIEAHFHFFIIIGFIALYQDWVPFLLNVIFTVISHGVGSAWPQTLIFNHPAAQGNPWLWSLIHGVAVLFACVGMALFWRITEDSQREKDILQHQLAQAEINRRQFTSDLLVNLARRNQSMFYRQLEIINQLEESEQDPDALAELFKLDHLATRVQRNAESLLVLSGEQQPRVWREPVALRDVVRAAIAETEDLDRVSMLVDERPAIAGHSVADATHMLAELIENAVRFSPPDSRVRISVMPDRRHAGGQLLTIEDWGIGMNAEDLATANFILAEAPDIDLAVAQRLGFHVVARLSARHGIRVSLSPTPGSGTTAVVALPVELFDGAPNHGPNRDAPSGTAPGSTGNTQRLLPGVTPSTGDRAAPAAETVVMASAGSDVSHRIRLTADDTLPGWWAGAEVIATDQLVPAQRSAPVDDGEGRHAAAEDAGLRRRVPLAHMAPELRTPNQPDAGRTAVPAHRADGAAIARFHAGRSDAPAISGGRPDAHPGPDPGGPDPGGPDPGGPDLGGPDPGGPEQDVGPSAWFEPVTRPDPDFEPDTGQR